MCFWCFPLTVIQWVVFPLLLRITSSGDCRPSNLAQMLEVQHRQQQQLQQQQHNHHHQQQQWQQQQCEEVKNLTQLSGFTMSINQTQQTVACQCWALWTSPTQTMGRFLFITNQNNLYSLVVAQTVFITWASATQQRMKTTLNCEHLIMSWTYSRY